MLGIIREATGLSPIVVPHGLNYGITYLVGRQLSPEVVAAITPKLIVDPIPNPTIRIPTDDWPFLYLRPGSIPYAYLSVLLVIVVTSTLAIRRGLRQNRSATHSSTPPVEAECCPLLKIRTAAPSSVTGALAVAEGPASNPTASATLSPLAFQASA